MEENQTPILQNDQNIKQDEPVKIKKTGLYALRAIIMVVLQISNIAFGVSIGYLFVTYLMSVLGVNLSPFFGGVANSLTLGFSATIGFFLYFVLFLVGALIIGLIMGFVKMNNNYSSVLRSANEQNMDIALAPGATISCFISFIIVIPILVFLDITFYLNDMLTLPIIFLFVATIALVLAFILTIVLSIINRIKFSKISEAEKIIVREQSRAFQIKKEKKERKRRVGKLY